MPVKGKIRLLLKFDTQTKRLDVVFGKKHITLTNTEIKELYSSLNSLKEAIEYAGFTS